MVYLLMGVSKAYNPEKLTLLTRTFKCDLTQYATDIYHFGQWSFYELTNTAFIPTMKS